MSLWRLAGWWVPVIALTTAGFSQPYAFQILWVGGDVCPSWYPLTYDGSETGPVLQDGTIVKLFIDTDFSAYNPSNDTYTPGVDQQVPLGDGPRQININEFPFNSSEIGEPPGSFISPELVYQSPVVVNPHYLLITYENAQGGWTAMYESYPVMFGQPPWDDIIICGELPPPFPQPPWTLLNPCTLSFPVTDLAIRYDAVGTLLDLCWTSGTSGVETVWMTTNPGHDGDPNGGADPDWISEGSVVGDVGSSAYLSVPIRSDYGVFVVEHHGMVSNIVGYLSIDLPQDPGRPTCAIPFGLPFRFWDVVTGVPTHGVESGSPSDIIGDQINPGDAVSADKIVRQDGQLAFRDSDNGDQWTGILENNSSMLPGWAFWYVFMHDPDEHLILAGEVDNSGDYGSFEIPAPTVAGEAAAQFYSWRDSRRVPVEDLGLIEQGFAGGNVVTSDKLVNQNTGALVNYLTATQQFAGGFDRIEPGHAYWIVNKQHNQSWTYNYDPTP